MPESRQRKNRRSTRSAVGTSPRGPHSIKRWAAPAMLVCWLGGLVWVVLYYIAGTDIPGMRTLGDWNLLLGMGLIAVGFVFATQWE